MYCVGGSLKNLCNYEMGGGGGWQMLTSSGGGGRSMLTGGGGKICQNLADVICERFLKAGQARRATIGYFVYNI